VRLQRKKNERRRRRKGGSSAGIVSVRAAGGSDIQLPPPYGICNNDTQRLAGRPYRLTKHTLEPCRFVLNRRTGGAGQAIGLVQANVTRFRVRFAVAQPSVTLTRGNGTVVCERCRVAATLLRRLRGLLGRRRLERGEGLLIRPCSSVHTFFMRFTIDVVFLDRDGHVRKVVPELRPWRIAWCRGAREVVELAAGEARRHGLAVGDKLGRTHCDAPESRPPAEEARGVA
jgi:uncharacterized protein